MNHNILDQNYIDAFFGDTSIIDEMSNTELKKAISSLRRQWIDCGDYTRGIDPTASEIFNFVKH